MTVEDFVAEWRNGEPTVEVCTSGSTGQPKKMYVEKKRMLASAKKTCDFLRLRPGDHALLCLSVDYIAGKMMVVRSIERDLKLDVIAPSGHPLADVDSDFDLVAMVPMQVFNTLEVQTELSRLRRIRHLIIGGGAIDERLRAKLQDMPNSIWSTYGMTETLSHVALRRLNGPEANEWYTPFDGIKVSVDSLSRIVIDAPQICYSRIVTNDIGEMSADGVRFKVLGRIDNVVCSGGIKIQIEDIEEQLRDVIVGDFMLTKVTDERLGEKMVMIYTTGEQDEIAQACSKKLPPYKRPKQFLKVDHLPLTETGKPARRRAAMLFGDVV